MYNRVPCATGFQLKLLALELPAAELSGITVTYKKLAADFTDYADGAQFLALDAPIRVIREIRGYIHT